MKLTFLFGLLIGILTGASVTAISTNARWQWKAWNHRAAVWTYADPKSKPRFEWADDYTNRVHVTPAPNPERRYKL